MNNLRNLKPNHNVVCGVYQYCIADVSQHCGRRHHGPRLDVPAPFSFCGS